MGKPMVCGRPGQEPRALEKTPRIRVARGAIIKPAPSRSAAQIGLPGSFRRCDGCRRGGARFSSPQGGRKQRTCFVSMGGDA